jgi:hypothetical protein
MPVFSLDVIVRFGEAIASGEWDGRKNSAG